MYKSKIRVYNTATRRVEELVPCSPNVVKGYVCGPTPYDLMHVGHARVYSFFDTFRRFLEHVGYNVVLVINFTDVDDKILSRARKEFGNEALRRWREIPERYIREFFEVCSRLYIREASYYPKVTDHIDDMVESIRKLVEKGYAYVASDGSVYFSVEKIEDYGSFSGQDVRSLIAGARVEVEPGKRNPLDFALWKSWKEGDPWWSSPWSPGRPGWHLECVIMSSKYLGVPFDFHGGGLDLVFPHHENEIAIARALFGVKLFAKHWIHVGLVTVRGEKMAKSLGNIIPVKDVLSKYDGEVLRLYYAMTHYRRPLDFTFEGLDQARSLLRTLYTAYDYALQALREARSEGGEKDSEVLRIAEELERKVIESMCDDVMTHDVVTALLECAKYITSTLIYEVDKMGNSSIHKLITTYRSVCNILGILNRAEMPRSVVDLVEMIVEVRSTLRKLKMYEVSDSVRARLGELGIVLSDSRVRTYWTIDRDKFSLR